MKRLVFVFVLLAASAAVAQERTSELDKAYEEARAACTALEQAEARREQGREPLPGERLGTAAGTSRLTEPYFERQAMLEQEMERARERCAQAMKRWNDLK
ncbi:MAG TPA: hypothetical protein VN929_13420 [Burkholderiales bacterium]|nr:hypothetical protein [Burkholderiales bacterium]